MAFRFMGGTGMDERPPTDWHIWFDDFDNFEADQWVITTTEAGASSATEVISNAKDGVLLITNDAADDDADFFQWSGDDASGAVETWKWGANKSLYFGARFKVSDATQSDWVFGLQITDTTPLAVSDGIYFRKDDGDANIDLVRTKEAGTSGTKLAAATCVSDTWMVLEFYYDGTSGRIIFYKDGDPIGAISTAYVPDDEELTISFGIQNGEAVAKTMSVDWIKVGQLRG